MSDTPIRLVLLLVLAASAGAAAGEPAIRYAVGKWATRGLGNHRIVVRVAKADGSAPGVLARLPWRRRDAKPHEKAVLVVDAKTGKRIANAVAVTVTKDLGEIVFEPASGAGEYYVYYLPATVGGGSFPRSSYARPAETAEAAWRDRVGLKPASAGDGRWRELPRTEIVAYQSASEFDRFDEMEIAATAEEVRLLLGKHAEEAFLVFPESRRRPIRMTDDLPQRWIGTGPQAELVGKAHRNECYAFQLGLFAARQALKNVRVRFEDMKSASGATAGRAIPASAFTCLNVGGVDWTGRAFAKAVSVPKGKVQAMWCAVQIPRGAAPGHYRGAAVVEAAGLPARRVAIRLDVDDKVLVDRGDGEPWRHSRLRWLNSTIALDDEVVRPFQPLRVSGRTITCLGRKVTLGEDGLPASIQSCFSPSVTRLLRRGREILAAPVRLSVIAPDGSVRALRTRKMTFAKKAPGLVGWRAESSGDDLALKCEASMEFDGWLEFAMTLTAAGPTDVADIRLEIPLLPGAAKYMMGMGRKGGRRPPRHEWEWDRRKHQDSVWVGDVNAGLRCQLKGANYRRPLVNIHYHHRPIQLPASWHNGGKGRCTITEEGGRVVLRASGGPRTLRPGEPLRFGFTLLITPMKPLNTDVHWARRYYHRGEPDPARVKADGANVINIHHAGAINPYINYPFLRVPQLKRYVDRVHEAGLKIKLYYTVRELTNHVPELWALRSLDDEVLAGGPGGGSPWLTEHIGPDYIQAWCAPRVQDSAIITSGMSRWHNYYLEGLDWLCRNVGIDGLYIDDVAFDRTVMKRARKVLDRARPGSLIDLHSWNHYNGRAGFASCANLYMESLPYVDRIWFGEGFAYNREKDDYWLVEISGIPFGVMGEMLQGGGNPWRGMLYGMTNRLGWSGDPRPIWKLWDGFRMAGAQMIGYWDPACPVKVGRDDVLATVYRKKGRTLIALASWAGKPVNVKLAIDFRALGLPADKATLTAPAVRGLQPVRTYRPGEAIPVEPLKGCFLTLTSE